jgi:uncharacterized membrane protein (DUF485 family)
MKRRSTFVFVPDGCLGLVLFLLAGMLIISIIAFGASWLDIPLEKEDSTWSWIIGGVFVFLIIYRLLTKKKRQN